MKLNAILNNLLTESNLPPWEVGTRRVIDRPGGPRAGSNEVQDDSKHPSWAKKSAYKIWAMCFPGGSASGEADAFIALYDHKPKDEDIDIVINIIVAKAYPPDEGDEWKGPQIQQDAKRRITDYGVVGADFDSLDQRRIGNDLPLSRDDETAMHMTPKSLRNRVRIVQCFVIANPFQIIWGGVNDIIYLGTYEQFNEIVNSGGRDNQHITSAADPVLVNVETKEWWCAGGWSSSSPNSWVKLQNWLN